MTDYALDMTIMLATHAALRRDLDRAKDLDTPNDGWRLFEHMLRMHHTIEDDLLWPVVRTATDQPDELALLDKMEAEHKEIEPGLEALDGTLAHGASFEAAMRDVETHVLDHLSHEERDALPLIDRTLTEEQWMTFGQASAQRMGPDMARYLPWMLEGADDETTARVLTVLPPPVQKLYAEQWSPAFAAIDRWENDSAM